ncbi:serine threonine kinase 33 [Fusarium phyllophilum]|uniref:Serine threonine kinase 33 n=1 Tax=Fusarium phyllophilum TaxID=47803 RepID=A0A8H5K5P0_9HYPO|nr:serine threonine kinase 33 [Fusarium phyllophilum]
MEVLGAIVGCTSLALDIFNFATAELEGRGIDALVLSLKHDVALLRDFARIFNAAAQSQQIPLTDKFLLNGFCLALQPSLAQTHSTIVRRKMSALTASPARKAIDKVHGFLYGKAEVQGIGKDLLQWTERYHVRFGLLPVGLQTRLLTQGIDESLPGDIKALRETFRCLTDRSRNTILDGLRKSEQMVTLRPGTSSSRMFATMNQKTVIVEFKQHNLAHSVGYMNDFEYDVAALARLLSGTDPLLCRTLKGEGYFHQPGHSAFAFIYQIPKLAVIPDDMTRPTTLLDLVVTTRPAPNKPGGIELIPPKHPLEQRFELARKITSAVMGASDYGQYDVDWDYDIYRHPKRQGLHPQSRYTMNHDLYSLGVVLLELGLWRPLRVMGLRNPDSISGSVKDHLKKLAMTGLPCMMGTKHHDVVLFCLDSDDQISNSTAVEEVLKKVEEMALGLQ